MHLAVLDPQRGAPYSAPLYYAAHWSEGEDPDAAQASRPPRSKHPLLIFVSAPHSLHSRALVQNPQASASIADPQQEIAQIHGLQLRGWVQAQSQWSAKTLAQVKARYLERHPQAKRQLEQQLQRDRARFYGLRITWAKSTDNRIAFGHHEIFEFPAPA